MKNFIEGFNLGTDVAVTLIKDKNNKYNYLMYLFSMIFQPILLVIMLPFALITTAIKLITYKPESLNWDELLGTINIHGGTVGINQDDSYSDIAEKLNIEFEVLHDLFMTKQIMITRNQRITEDMLEIILDELDQVILPF